MKPILRATMILSGSSVTSILISLISAKVMALLLKPAGYGYYGLVQSFVAVVSLLGGMGMATGLVRVGAGASERGEADTLSQLRAGAWLVFAVTGSLTVGVLIVFRHALAMWAFRDTSNEMAIPILAIAVLFTVASTIHTGTLNMCHRIEALAGYGVANSLLGAICTITTIFVWRLNGILGSVVGSAALSWLLARFMVRKYVGGSRSRVTGSRAWASATSLAKFGGPYTASMFMGSGVQLALPILVVHMLDANSVGYYKAASAISVGYLGFLVNAMGQDYYPRISASKGDPSALNTLINEQHRLVMLLAIPLVLFTLAVVPYLIPIVYSRSFSPAVDILEWQLIGDIFKFTSWTMSFAILGRCSISVYLLVEGAGGVLTLGTVWLGTRWFGLSGLGISFLATYIAYYLVVWFVIRRETGLRWTGANKRLLMMAVSMAAIVRILSSSVRFGNMRTGVALGFAIVAGIITVVSLRKQYLGGKKTFGGTLAPVGVLECDL